jgi:hypothetical protein
VGLEVRTGDYAQTTTTLNLYSHAIQTADEMAAEAIGDLLQPKGTRNPENLIVGREECKELPVPTIISTGNSLYPGKYQKTDQTYSHFTYFAFHPQLLQQLFFYEFLNITELQRRLVKERQIRQGQSLLNLSGLQATFL